MPQITIAAEHSANSRPVKRKTLTVSMMGGNPEIGFIWIDDVCHTITKKARGGFSIKKTI